MERAARASLDLLQCEATCARRGRNGARVERVALTVAIFQHGESRPAKHSDGRVFGDPNLHVHCVALAMATRADGTVGALHSVAQRDFKMCFGAQFHAALAFELQLLGFEIDRVGPNGVFEIAGVGQAMIEYFSARRNEIVQELEKHGVDSRDVGALAAAVAKATRGPKDETASERREEIWVEAARARGVDVETFSENLRRTDRAFDLDAAEKIFDDRLADLPRSLTEMQSVVDRKDLLRAVAAALVGTGLPAQRVDAGIERLLESGAIVEIGRDRLDHPRYSTPEMMRLEREVVASATRLATRGGFALDEIDTRARCARARSATEQTAAAVAMTGARAVSVVSGSPGSGKTTTLAPAVDGYRAAGRRVLGAAPAWRTANALRDDLAIPARAIASWLERARRGGEFLRAGDVLVVDEAGLINPRDMHALLAEVDRADAKIVLVGDPKQLQAIGGPGLRLVQRAVDSVRVETIVRQHDQWQRDAIRAFGDGRAEEALAGYAENGRVVEAEGHAAAVAKMVERWRKARAVDPTREPMLLARTNADVNAISRVAREALRAEGVITGPEIAFAAATPSGQTTTIALAQGDRICFLARNDALGVVNGSNGTVLAVRADASGAPDRKIRIDAEISGRLVTFSVEDVTDKKGRARLGWAYAQTVYQSQGMTVDDAVALVDPAYDRHQIYVAASRARNSTTFVMDAKAIDQRIATDLPLDRQDKADGFAPEERRAWLAKRLAQARVQETTLDVADAAVAAREADRVSDARATAAQKSRIRQWEASLD